MEQKISQKKNIDDYVKRVLSEWPKWSSGLGATTTVLHTLHRSISEIHNVNRIPQTLLNISNTNPNGEFDTKTWSIQMNSDTLKNKNATKEEVVTAAKMMYSGAAKTEIRWIEILKALYTKRTESVGKFTIPINDQNSVAQNLNVRPAILAKAVEAVCKLPKGPLPHTTALNEDVLTIEKKVHNALLAAFGSTAGTVPPAAKPQPKPPQPPAKPPQPPAKPQPKPPQPPAKPQPKPPQPPAKPQPKPPQPPAKPQPKPPQPPAKPPVKSPVQGWLEEPHPPFLKNLGNIFTPPPKTPKKNTFPKVEDPKDYWNWPRYSMIHPAILNDYIFQVVWGCWEGWKKGEGKVETRAHTLHQILSDIHKRCGIPTTRFVEINNSGGTNGSFGSHNWTIEVNKNRVKSLKLEPNNFLGIAETVYHEGRHAEQAWLVAVERFFTKRVKNSEGKFVIPDHLFQEIRSGDFSNGIELNVLKKAAEVACKRAPVPSKLSGEALKKRQHFVRMIQEVYDAWWGSNSNLTDAIMNNLHISPWGVAYERYLNLPFERDAHAIQTVIRGLHKRMGDFDAWATEEHLKQIPKDFKPFW